MIVLFDIDDTLLKNSKYPSNYTKIINLVDEMKSYGLVFGISTNRPFDNTVKKIIKDYHINGPIMTESGSCLYKKIIIAYKLLNRNNFHLEKIVKKIVSKYLKENDINKNQFIISKSRVSSLSISIPDYENINTIINTLKSDYRLKNTNITRDYYGKTKIYITMKNINKISGIKKFLKNEEVILITDFENKMAKVNSRVKVYSVGNNSAFNKKCYATHEGFGNGIEKILLELRRKVK